MADAMLIDGTNLLHRGYFAQSRSNPDMTAEDAITLLNSMVAGWVRRQNIIRPRTFIMFDGPNGAKKRRALHPEYKAGRPDKHPELYRALDMAPTHPKLHDSGSRIICIEDHEADDVIASYANALDQRGFESLIVTSDKDLLQMVRARVVVAAIGNSMQKADFYDVPTFYAKYGFEPALIADHKALVGDKSDAIPGVSGIGEIVAKKLIIEFGCIEEIYAAGADRIRALVGTAYTDKLLSGYDDALKFLEVTKLDQEIPVQLRGEGRKDG